jgi:hypothetical protein
MDIQSASPTQITISPPAPAAGSGQFFSGAQGPNFGDLVDTLNPLEHIPIVSSIYHAIRGESHEISPAANIIGGALFGGVFGLVAGLADVIFHQATGHSVGGAVMASLRGDSSAEAVQYAARDAGQVHLGDFAGDVKLALRSRLYDGETQYARNEAPPLPQQVAQAAPVEQVAQDEAPPARLAALNHTPPSDMAAPAGAVDAAQRAKDAQVLSLFGNSKTPSAAYQQANLRAYLKDASTNIVM